MHLHQSIIQGHTRFTTTRPTRSRNSRRNDSSSPRPVSCVSLCQSATKKGKEKVLCRSSRSLLPGRRSGTLLRLVTLSRSFRPFPVQGPVHYLPALSLKAGCLGLGCTTRCLLSTSLSRFYHSSVFDHTSFRLHQSISRTQGILSTVPGFRRSANPSYSFFPSSHLLS